MEFSGWENFVNQLGCVDPCMYDRYLPDPEIKKSCNLEVSMFKIMQSGFYYTNLEQINSREFLNLFLE